MPALIKLERDRLLAERATLRSMIERLDAEDVMSRFGLEDRLAEVEAEIDDLGVIVDRNASLALFFGGRPVIGQRGIEANFAGSIIRKFQDLVSKVMAEELRGLGQRGPVPAIGSSTMHVTSVVRGSFGFLLEEINDQGQLVETALDNAVEKAGRILLSFSSENEEDFERVMEDADGRVLQSVREIFQTLENNEATIRLVTHNIDHAFSGDAIEMVLNRALTTDVHEDFPVLEGVAAGFLPDGHMFEFRIGDETLRGKISKEISSEEIAGWNRQFLFQQVKAQFLKTSVLKNGEVVRSSFKLLDLIDE